jgi:hypothetical protein
MKKPPETVLRRRVRAEAWKCVPNVTGVSHVLPYAYCVATPARHCAVFAVPPLDREPQVKDDQFVTVQNESAEGVALGCWYALAYVCGETSSGSRVILCY